MNRSVERTGAARSNVDRLLASPDSELAQDPYALEFLGPTGGIAQRDLEQALTDRIVDTLRELGPGCAPTRRRPCPAVRARASPRRSSAPYLQPMTSPQHSIGSINDQ